MNYKKSVSILAFIFICLTGVFYIQQTSNKQQKPIPSKQISYKIVTINETFLTKQNHKNNIDSVAVWHGPAGQHWLLATAKATHKIFVYDAATGLTIKNIGSLGTSKEQFSRPNGIAVIDNLVFIVERDNHRVQILTLPDFKTIGFVGEKYLKKPYGLSIYKKINNKYKLHVTDNYKADNIKSMNKRVHCYEVEIKNEQVKSKFISSFGFENGKIVLRKVESILADTEYNRLFIADESAKERNIKIYTLNGKFTGKLLGKKGLFKKEPEGIALYATGTKTGYIIATDQGHKRNIFHIFDRNTLRHLGAFRGPKTKNTDGITVTTKSFGPFKNGAFYAVHDDKSVAVFNWNDIARKLNLK